MRSSERRSAPWAAAGVLLAALPLGAQTEPRRAPLVVEAGTPASRLECVVERGLVPPVTAVAFVPSRSLLAAGGRGEVVLWDVQEGRLAGRLGAGRLSGQVLALACPRTGGLLAAGDGAPGRRGAVHLLDLDTGQVLASFTEPGDAVRSVAFSPDGTLLAAGAGDALVRVYDVAAQKLVASLAAHAGAVDSVAFTPDGKLLLSGGADRTVHVHATADWKLATSIHLPDEVRAVTTGTDELLIAAVGDGRERALRLRPKLLAKNQPVRAVDLAPAAPLDVAWIGSTGRLAVACSDAGLRIHDPAKGSTARFATGHADWIYAVASDATGTRIATGGADGLVQLFTGQGALLATLAHLAPGQDSWLVVSAPGYLDGSDPGQVRARTRTPAGASPDRPALELRDVARLRQVLAGKPVPPPPAK